LGLEISFYLGFQKKNKVLLLLPAKAHAPLEYALKKYPQWHCEIQTDDDTELSALCKRVAKK
jgi:hypothetical protein